MNENNYNVLGIMSGTSLDGIDVALLNFRKNGDWSYEIETAETIPYSDDWQRKLSKAVFFDDSQLQLLNEDYTEHLAQVILDFIKRHNISDLDAVCSHGHTIKHEPENGFTLQIGNLPRLAKLLNQKVVCDFRVQDVQMGGQGAPLVPIGDCLLFPEYDFCLNLGGFANVSTEINGNRVAYDICAVNTVLNHLALQLGMAYDKDGNIAASGELDESFLEQLNKLPFYDLKPPKSLGIEWVNKNIFPLLKKTISVASALKTYSIHAATQIAKELNKEGVSKVLVTGGGAFNSYLMKEIQKRTETEVIIPSPLVVNYKEALIFGFLGVLKLRNEVNVLSSVTGASKDHSTGVVLQPS